jgi:hypothetical protein
MAIRVRRGTDAQRLTVVLQDGEIAWTTDTQEFYVGDGVTLGGVFIGPSTGAFVPLTRNITINGITQDLSVDRTWTIAAGVTSVNTATGAVSLLVSNTGTGGTLQWNTTTLEIPEAASTKTGLLTSTDWTTFNNKVTSISAGTGISVGGTTTIPIVTNTAPDQVVALTAGTGIGITGAYPNFTITNSSPSSGGTVTSVGLALPTEFAISGSPVTGSGTLTGTWNTQNANTVLAGPSAGVPATPTFRSLVAADIPALPYISTTLTSANIIVGDGTNTAAAVSMSGDASISNTGVVTLTNTSVTGQAITGYVSGAGTIAATDTILQAIQKLDGNSVFTIHANFANINPADATTYYFGAQYTVAPGTGATARIFYIPYDCTLIGYTIGISYTVGSAQDSQIYCRINNTTDVQLGGNFSGTATIFTQGTTAATNLSAGDFLNIKWVCPTWTTNPTAATGTVILYLKRR